MQPGYWRVVVLGLAAIPAQPVFAQNTIQVRIANEYTAYVNVVIGNARRVGTDSVNGTLTLQSNGNWEGVVDAKVKFKQAMQAFGIVACPEADYEGSQRLHLSGKPVSAFDRSRQTITDSLGLANGGFLEISVKPAGPPNMNSTDCLTLFEGAGFRFPLLPLNDVRWNQQTSGYVIGLPQAGPLVYTDATVQTFQTNINTSKPVEASSSWKIRVDRR